MNCRGYGLDQNEESSVMALYDALTADDMLPDAVILNAADLGMNMDALTVPAEAFARVITTNIVGEFLLIREAAVAGSPRGQASRLVPAPLLVGGSSNIHRRSGEPPQA